jgi:hypothetical protein
MDDPPSPKALQSQDIIQFLEGTKPTPSRRISTRLSTTCSITSELQEVRRELAQAKLDLKEVEMLKEIEIK